MLPSSAEIRILPEGGFQGLFVLMRAAYGRRHLPASGSYLRRIIHFWLDIYV